MSNILQSVVCCVGGLHFFLRGIVTLSFWIQTLKFNYYEFSIQHLAKEGTAQIQQFKRTNTEI